MQTSYHLVIVRIRAAIQYLMIKDGGAIPTAAHPHQSAQWMTHAPEPFAKYQFFEFLEAEKGASLSKRSRCEPGETTVIWSMSKQYLFNSPKIDSKI